MNLYGAVLVLESFYTLAFRTILTVAQKKDSHLARVGLQNCLSLNVTFDVLQREQR
jgi:hypothetical protein